MNVAFFLTLKDDVAYILDTCTVRQGLEKMRSHGYTAIPVITKENKYVGTVSEGDFLWYIVKTQAETDEIEQVYIKSLEDVYISDILKKDRNPTVPITATIEELLIRAMRQNFIPVIDDLGSFVGIVTRKTIIKYCCNNQVKVR